MANNKFTLRSNLGWELASSMLGVDKIKAIGWTEETSEISSDPTVVGGFKEILDNNWKPENNLAFTYSLPQSCDVCMDSETEETPFDLNDAPCTEIEDDRCKCKVEDDPGHLCPHYRESGESSLDVYVTLVKIKKGVGDDDDSGMFGYYKPNTNECKTIWKEKLCTKEVVPQPLLDYGYFPVPIPRFIVTIDDGTEYGTNHTFDCATPLWVSNLQPKDAQQDDKIQTAKEAFGDDEEIVVSGNEGVEREL
tara:strand:- start:8 stop:757 length:750 start_codon:yes stop_codon:yes gene_type:complete